MRTVYDQLGKGLLRDTLTRGGDMHPEHEVTSAPQGIDDAREFLMSTQTLYEQWAQTLTEQSRNDGLQRGLAQGLKKGRLEGLRQALLTVYRARFGAVPVEVASRIEATREIPRLERWLEQIGTGSAEDFAAALRA